MARPPIGSVPLCKDHIDLPTNDEPEFLVEADGVLVVFEDVKIGFFAALPNRSRHIEREFPSESLTPYIRMSTHGADLDETRHAKPFTGHREQTSVATKTDIATQLEGARQEGPGLGQLGKRQHVQSIVGPEPNDVEARGGRDLFRDHLPAMTSKMLLPTVWRSRNFIAK